MHTPILTSQHSGGQSASTQGPDQLIMGSLHVCKAILLQIPTELSKCANVPVLCNRVSACQQHSNGRSASVASPKQSAHRLCRGSFTGVQAPVTGINEQRLRSDVQFEA